MILSDKAFTLVMAIDLHSLVRDILGVPDRYNGLFTPQDTDVLARALRADRVNHGMDIYGHSIHDKILEAARRYVATGAGSATAVAAYNNLPNVWIEETGLATASTSARIYLPPETTADVMLAAATGRIYHPLDTPTKLAVGAVLTYYANGYKYSTDADYNPERPRFRNGTKLLDVFFNGEYGRQMAIAVGNKMKHSQGPIQHPSAVLFLDKLPYAALFIGNNGIVRLSQSAIRNSTRLQQSNTTATIEELAVQATTAQTQLEEYRQTVTSAQALNIINQLTDLFNPQTMSLERFYLAQNLIDRLINLKSGKAMLLIKIQGNLQRVAQYAKAIGVDMTTHSDIEPSDEAIVKKVNLDDYVRLPETERAALRLDLIKAAAQHEEASQTNKRSRPPHPHYVVKRTASRGLLLQKAVRTANVVRG